ALGLRNAARVEFCAKLGEPCAPKDEARIGPPFRDGLRRGIAIERDQPVARTEEREDAARMSAAAERGIDVNTIRLDLQRSDGFFEQRRSMDALRHQDEKTSHSG